MYECTKRTKAAIYSVYSRVGLKLTDKVSTPKYFNLKMHPLHGDVNTFSIIMMLQVKI